MKKIVTTFLLAIAIIFIILGFMSCDAGFNKQLFDVTYGFEKAIAYLPNGEILEGKLESWNDYENSDQIQIKIDGKTYLLHSMNVALISEK